MKKYSTKSPYALCIRDNASDSGRIYPAKGTTLLSAKREANRWAREGYIGGSVEVVDATPTQGYRECHHVAERTPSGLSIVDPFSGSRKRA